MTGEEYPIATLYDMARIPAEAVPRFIAELPSILAEVRHVQGVAAAFDVMFDGAFKMNLEAAGKPTWKDDDLGVGVTRVTMPNGDVIRRERNLRPTSEEAGA